MSKNLKLTYILFFVFSAVIISWTTLTAFFSGVAINFIGLIALLFVIMLISYSEKGLSSRIKDLLIVAGAFCLLELVMYFACEFGHGETLKGFIVYQNIISFLGLLFFAYIAFRFTMEFRGKKIKFVEILLGNQKITKKPKKAKEVSNGSLEEKPNTITDSANHEQNETNKNETDKNETEENETNIIIETEE